MGKEVKSIWETTRGHLMEVLKRMASESVDRLWTIHWYWNDVSVEGTEVCQFWDRFKMHVVHKLDDVGIAMGMMQEAGDYIDKEGSEDPATPRIPEESTTPTISVPTPTKSNKTPPAKSIQITNSTRPTPTPRWSGRNI